MKCRHNFVEGAGHIYCTKCGMSRRNYNYNYNHNYNRNHAPHYNHNYRKGPRRTGYRRRKTSRAIIPAILVPVAGMAALFMFGIVDLSDTVPAGEQIPTVQPPTISPPELQPVQPPTISPPELQPVQPPTIVPSTPQAATASTPSPEVVAEMKQYMLDLVNSARLDASLKQVALGDNTAAQSHADSMLADCFSSHWGTDGLKPYMRYSLAGGYQYNGENISGLDYCIKPWENYAVTSPRADISQAFEGLMSSSGHRDNILDPHHSYLNIGLAWDKHNMMIVQHFEYDYVTFHKEPSINHGSLFLSVSAKNGAKLTDSPIQIYYDPPPHQLTTGQLAGTYCYDYGPLVASLRHPAPPGSYYPTDSHAWSHSATCPDPYNTAADTPPPRSVADAQAAYRAAKLEGTMIRETPSIIPYVDVNIHGSPHQRLVITADISKILSEHGSGVYTVMIWGTHDGNDVPLSLHSIFYNAPA